MFDPALTDALEAMRLCEAEGDPYAKLCRIEIERLRNAERARVEWLRSIVDDVETRYPTMHIPDELSDWGKGVLWMLDRLRNIADDLERSDNDHYDRTAGKE